MLRILGAGAVVLGAVWVLQGLKLGPPGPMSGHLSSSLLGAGLAVVGVVLFLLGRTRR